MNQNPDHDLQPGCRSLPPGSAGVSRSGHPAPDGDTAFAIWLNSQPRPFAPAVRHPDLAPRLRGSLGGPLPQGDDVTNLDRPGRITGTPPTEEQQKTARLFAVKVLLAAERFRDATHCAPIIEIHPDDAEQYLKALSGFHPPDSDHPGDWVYPSMNPFAGGSVFGFSVVPNTSVIRGCIRLVKTVVIEP